MNNAEEIAYYSQRFAEHGPGWQAADWGSEDSQFARFEVLREAIDKGSVLDVGCGSGEFRDWLSPGDEYEGWELVPEYASAYVKTRDLLASREHDAYDHVIASGLFTHRDYEFMWNAIRRMWELARRTVAFNFLTTWGDPHPNEFQASPMPVFRHGSTYTRKIVFRTDYLGAYDATIIMVKG